MGSVNQRSRGLILKNILKKILNGNTNSNSAQSAETDNDLIRLLLVVHVH